MYKVPINDKLLSHDSVAGPSLLRARRPVTHCQMTSETRRTVSVTSSEC